MAVDAAPDIILDVIKAADPARASAAAQRLYALSNATPAQSAGFADALENAAPVTIKTAAASPPAPATQAAGAHPRALSASAKAKVEFEGMLLNELVGQMLPKDASVVFGEGFAGEAWKSMLSEQVARQIAKSGTLHIADRLFESHPIASSGEKIDARTQSLVGNGRTAQMGANALSLPAVEAARES